MLLGSTSMARSNTERELLIVKGGLAGLLLVGE